MNNVEALISPLCPDVPFDSALGSRTMVAERSRCRDLTKGDEL
jgi:hypothetical protein